MYRALETRDRTPLTKKDSLYARSAWTSDERPQGEKARSDWKEGAIRFYMILGSLDGSPLYSFPSVFQFTDGGRIPDKGTIKVWLRNKLIDAASNAYNEVEAFRLTDAGRERLGLGETE